MANSDSAGIDRVKAKEQNTQRQAGSGGGPKKYDGPVPRSISTNPTQGGGINRATKGK